MTPAANLDPAPNQLRAYSMGEYAELLGISKRTVAREIKSGRLRATRIRRRVLIAWDEGLRYLRDLADEGDR